MLSSSVEVSRVSLIHTYPHPLTTSPSLPDLLQNPHRLASPMKLVVSWPLIRIDPKVNDGSSRHQLSIRITNLAPCPDIEILNRGTRHEHKEHPGLRYVEVRCIGWTTRLWSLYDNGSFQKDFLLLVFCRRPEELHGGLHSGGTSGFVSGSRVFDFLDHLSHAKRTHAFPSDKPLGSN